MDFSRLINRVPALFFVWQINHETTESSFLYISDHCEEMYGIPASQAMKDRTCIVNLMVEEDVEPFSAAVLQSMQDLSIVDRYARMRRPDGKLIHIHYKSIPRRETREGVQYTVWDGVVVEVTNASIRQEYYKEQVQSMIRDALQPMFAVDVQGTITEWNPLLEDSTGFTRSEVLDTPILDWIQPQDQAKFVNFAAQQQQKEKNQKGSASDRSPERDFQFKAKDGTTRYIRVRVKVTSDINNEVSGLVFSCQDMTLMKEAQQQKDAALMLVHKERGLTEWLSHEVRNPLSVSMEALLTLKELTDPNRDLAEKSLSNQRDYSAEECIQVMAESITYVVDLLNNMMDLDQCSQGKMPVTVAPCHVRDEVLLPTFKMMKSLRPQHPVQLQLVAPPTDIVATVDKLRLRQVLTNLIANAFKFTTTGFVEVLLKVPSNPSNSPSVTQSLQFCVRDSGCGVQTANYDTLFTKWEQLGSSRNGTGIGLCLCQALVKAMGGNILLNREYDSGVPGFPGAEFIVNLPIVRSSAPHKHTKHKRASSRLSSIIGSKLKSPDTSIGKPVAEPNVSSPPLPALFSLSPPNETRTDSEGSGTGGSASSVSLFESNAEPITAMASSPKPTSPLFSLQQSADPKEDIPRKLEVTTSPTEYPSPYKPCYSRRTSISGEASLGIEPLTPSFVSCDVDIPTAPKNSFFTGKYTFLIVDDEKMGRKFLRRRFSRLFPEAIITEVASGEEALVEAAQRTYDVITMDHFMAVDERNGDETIRRLRLNHNDSLIVGISGNDKQAEHFAAGADAFFQKPLPSDHLLAASFQRYLAPPADWKVLILSHDSQHASTLQNQLYQVAAHHFTTLEEARKRWDITMLSNGTEAIERLSVKKSYDCVIFNRCNGENDTNDVSILKYLRDLAKARDIVLVDCTHDCSPETCPEHDVEFGSGIVFWCNKQGLPSIQEMRQSLCYALLSSRNNSTSPDSSSNEEAKAAMEMKPICTRVKPRRTKSGVAQSA